MAIEVFKPDLLGILKRRRRSPQEYIKKLLGNDVRQANVKVVLEQLAEQHGLSNAFLEEVRKYVAKVEEELKIEDHNSFADTFESNLESEKEEDDQNVFSADDSLDLLGEEESESDDEDPEFEDAAESEGDDEATDAGQKTKKPKSKRRNRRTGTYSS